MVICIIVGIIFWGLLSFIFDTDILNKKKMFHKGKVRCEVCGHNIEINKEYTYEAVDNQYGIEHYYDCIDCPKCGCQITLKERKK